MEATREREQTEPKNKAQMEHARPEKQSRSPGASPGQQPSVNDSSVPLISQSQPPGHTGDYSPPLQVTEPEPQDRSQGWGEAPDRVACTGSRPQHPHAATSLGRRKARELMTSGRATKKEPKWHVILTAVPGDWHLPTALRKADTEKATVETHGNHGNTTRPCALRPLHAPCTRHLISDSPRWPVPSAA